MSNLAPYTKHDDGDQLVEAVVFWPSGIIEHPVRVTFKRWHFKIDTALKRTDFAGGQDSVAVSLTVEILGEPDALGVRGWDPYRGEHGDRIERRAAYILPELRAAYFAKNR